MVTERVVVASALGGSVAGLPIVVIGELMSEVLGMDPEPRSKNGLETEIVVPAVTRGAAIGKAVGVRGSGMVNIPHEKAGKGVIVADEKTAEVQGGVKRQVQGEEHLRWVVNHLHTLVTAEVITGVATIGIVVVTTGEMIIEARGGGTSSAAVMDGRGDRATRPMIRAMRSDRGAPTVKNDEKHGA